jgi:bifunctional UDP-N-acetylglucosamine pyrophosphorylase/glucosamine-1-phosphate N-acetyltransferase
MDAIILAAGVGTRLRPHTLTTPKPLLPIRGRPILDWALGALPARVDRVLVVTHYLGEQIEKFLQNQTQQPRWQVVRQEQPRGTGDALRSCRTHLAGGAFLVLNGDDLYGAADLEALADTQAGLLVHPVREPKRFGIAFLKPDGALEKLVEKPDLEGEHLANTGAYLFPPDVFSTELTLSSRGEYEITDYVSALARTRSVRGVRTQFWLPIGDVAAWQAAQSIDLAGAMQAKRAIFGSNPSRQGD